LALQKLKDQGPTSTLTGISMLLVALGTAISAFADAGLEGIEWGLFVPALISSIAAIFVKPAPKEAPKLPKE